MWAWARDCVKSRTPWHFVERAVQAVQAVQAVLIPRTRRPSVALPPLKPGEMPREPYLCWDVQRDPFEAFLRLGTKALAAQFPSGAEAGLWSLPQAKA